jgi:hypothetical protein
MQCMGWGGYRAPAELSREKMKMTVVYRHLVSPCPHSSCDMCLPGPSVGKLGWGREEAITREKAGLLGGSTQK